MKSQPLWNALIETDRRLADTDGSTDTLLSVSKDRGVLRYDELFPERAIRAENHDHYKFVEPGFIVLNKMSAATGAVGVATESGVVSPDYAVFIPRDGNNSKFIGYVLGSTDFCKNRVAPTLRGIGTGDATSVRTPRVGMREYLSLHIPFPSQETQERIADYLDRETAEIDAAVADLDKYVELLEKRRQVTIADAVTGRSGAASTRDSGIYWIGRVATDWDVVPAWRVMTERKEKSQPEDAHLTPSQTYGVVTQQDYMAITGNKVVLNLTGADSMKRVHPGDFIIHLRSFQGGIEASAVGGKVSNAYTVLIPSFDADFDFFRWFMKSQPFIEGLASSTDQLRDGQSINYSRFSRLSLPLPSLDTQRKIAAYLDHETAEIDTLIEESTRLRNLLLKRRSVLITDAVTGRKQV